MIHGNNNAGCFVSISNRWSGVPGRARRSRHCYVFPESDSGHGFLTKVKEQPRYQSAMVDKVMRIGEHTSVESAAGAIASELSNHAKVSLASSIPETRHAALDYYMGMHDGCHYP